MWTPTHILVTVSKARNLLEKGKGGNDAYCMIGMGKEKFLTSVRQKTLSPVWDEQAEFELTERADLKLTVYHKSSIIDEFIGRVVISVGDLFNENNKSFVKWYKLQSKEENSKKAAKERGEIEVRVEFITKPKTGSVMDLSSLSKTNKEKTLSLKNLKDKSHNFKHSFKENFKILSKSKSKSKINEDNQLGEQARRMNGSKLDFLDGEDMSSLTSSYSSLNGNRLTNNDHKQMNSMSRYNPSRSSVVSAGSSSRNDLDSLNSNPNDESLYDDNNNNNDESQMSFNRNSSFRRSSLRRPSKRSTKDNDTINEAKIHIAPLAPFSINNNNNNNSNNDQHQQRYHVLDSIIHEENTPNYQPQQKQHQQQNNLSPTNPFINDIKHEEPSFANIFTSSFASGLEKLDEVKIEPLIIQKEEPKQKEIVIPEIYISPKSTSVIVDQTSINSSAATLTKSDLSNNTKKIDKLKSVNNSNGNDDDEEDQIDWTSSDDEEIVKQEIETFERNQILDIEKLDHQKPASHHHNNNNNQEIDILLSSSDTQTTTTNIQTNLELDNSFPPTSTFSIDLDPFSSPTQQSPSSSFTNLNQIDTFFSQPNSNPVTFFDPFLDFKMSEQEVVEQQVQEHENEENPEVVNFDNDFEPEITENNFESEPQNNNNIEPDAKSNHSSSSSSDAYSIQAQRTQKKSETLEEPKNESDNEIEDMDNAFANFEAKLELKSDANDEISNLANDLAEATRQLDEIIEESQKDFELTDDDKNDDDELEQTVKSSELVTDESETNTFSRNLIMRQSERRRVLPTQDLTSDLNSERDFSTNNNNDSFIGYSNGPKSNRSSLKFDFNEKKNSKYQDDEIKTPDFDHNYIFQNEQNIKDEQETSLSINHSRGLPDLINQKEPTDKAKKYLEGLEGVKLNEMTVPDSLKKQLEYFDRDELLQLIAYQKKHLDLKESRIKDLENYIDNLVVKIIETEPLILMTAGCAPIKNKNY
ncbi:unnamed protein product [Brachionus calyciflorus]|uniref:C2 domain-containing protein n=1 Tax=Brachionus calyciflorus TaxID=104777 RepID=A0A813TS15_9BILA|nr:unnamed protein product [Brachionus calyciflorus]